MSIRSIMAAFAALVIAGRATAADTPLPITGITVNGGSVTLQWETPQGRSADDLRLEESSDLVNWDVVDNVKAPKGLGGANVSVGSDTKKFFRLYAADAPLPPGPGDTPVGGTFTNNNVEWIVLDEVGGKKLIMTTKVHGSDYGIDGGSNTTGTPWDTQNYWRPYSLVSLKDVMDTWWADNGGDMRAIAMKPSLLVSEASSAPWNTTFDSTLLITYASTITAPGADVSDENDTGGVVFPLSLTEVYKYLPGDDGNGNPSTSAHASRSAQNHNHPEYGNSWWWLRSPGANSTYVGITVSAGGTINMIGNNIDMTSFGFRPALWINP
ncbi:MAG: DUF6273 domain-containing protein [Kiritimatiellaeota bacterium]|nr:DUF6273 domain-containing protein [Kiritimatiellota bacterium]